MPRYEDLSKEELIHRLHEAEAVARACSKDLEVLRQSEERFRLFLDHSPTVAWIKDAAGRFVYLSKTFEQRLGVRLDDWYGKTDAEVWPRTTAEAFRKNDRGAAAPGSAERSTWHLESQSRRRNGVGNR